MKAADGNEALAHLVTLLNRHSVAYMLVGSYSSNAYGIPRATKDADIVVATLDETFDLIGSSLGDDFQTESQLEFELITGTMRRKICFRPINFVLEIFQLRNDSFDQSRFKRRLSPIFATIFETNHRLLTLKILASAASVGVFAISLE